MNAAHPVAQVRDDIQADLVHRFADILGIGFRVRGRDQNFLLMKQPDDVVGLRQLRRDRHHDHLAFGLVDQAPGFRDVRQRIILTNRILAAARPERAFRMHAVNPRAVQRLSGTVGNGFKRFFLGGRQHAGHPN